MTWVEVMPISGVVDHFKRVCRRNRGLALGQHAFFPQLLAGIRVGIEGINPVTFRGHEDDVVLVAFVHCQIGHVKRLGVHISGAVQTAGKEFPEVALLTTAGVSAYSFVFWPVRALSLWNVSTPARSVTATVTAGLTEPENGFAVMLWLPGMVDAFGE